MNGLATIDLTYIEMLGKDQEELGFWWKKDLLTYFKIEILDSSTEGILWINLKDSIDTSGDPYSFQLAFVIFRLKALLEI